MATNVVTVLSVILVSNVYSSCCILVNQNVTKANENLITLSRWYLPIPKPQIAIKDSLNVVPLDSSIPKNHAKVYSPPIIINTKKLIPEKRNVSIRLKPPRIYGKSANISRSYAIDGGGPLLLNGYRYVKDDIKPIHEIDPDKQYSLTNNRDHIVLDTSGHSAGQSFNEAYLEHITNVHYFPEELTSAIMTLDRFLRPLLSSDGYNIPVHPPVNPILSLILSRYGRYVPGTMNSRVYSYMATNNIHNHQPFGKYKLESEEEPIYH